MDSSLGDVGSLQNHPLARRVAFPKVTSNAGRGQFLEFGCGKAQRLDVFTFTSSGLRQLGSRIRGCGRCLASPPRRRRHAQQLPESSPRGPHNTSSSVLSWARSVPGTVAGARARRSRGWGSAAWRPCRDCLPPPLELSGRCGIPVHPGPPGSPRVALTPPASVLGSPGRAGRGGAGARAGVPGRPSVRARAFAAETRHLPRAEVRSRERARGPGVGGVALGCVLGGGDSSRCFLAGAPEAPPPQRARAAAQPRVR